MDENYQSRFYGEEIDQGISKILDGSVDAAASRATTAATEAALARDSAVEAGTDAGTRAEAAQLSATTAESWAVGGTGARPGEDLDNARYWAGEAHKAAGGGVVSFNGRSGSVLPQAGDYDVDMVTGAAAKVIPSAPGNLATLDAEGNLGDSGKNPGNFAPSGWGYGGALPQIIVTNETDGTVLETALDTFMETMPDLAAKQIRFMDSPYLVDYQMVGTLFKHSSGYCSLLGHAPNGSIVHKCKNADTGGWKPFEWVNQPMHLGVEYRTTERYMGKPVYTKLVDFGVLPQNTSKDLTHGIADVLYMLDCKGCLYDSTGNSNTIPFYQTAITGNAIELFATKTIIRAVTNYAVNAENRLRVTLKYTKTTD